MRSRISTFILRHSLFAAGSSVAFLSYTENQRRSLSERPGYKKISDVINTDDENQDVNLQRDCIIIQEAFKQVGFTQPIYVKYDEQTIGVFCTADKQGERAAFISIQDALLPENENRDLMLYAIMGHEAIHTQDKHAISANLAYGAALYISAYTLGRLAYQTKLIQLSLLPFGGLLAAGPLPSLFNLFVGIPQAYAGFLFYCSATTACTSAQLMTLSYERHQEKYADIQSANMLGTAKALATAFATMPPKEHEFLDVHPPIADRIDYLLKLESESARTPKLFQSRAYQDVVNLQQRLGVPRRSPNPPKITADTYHSSGGANIQPLR